MLKFIIYGLVLLLGIFVVYLTILFLFQDHFIFHPNTKYQSSPLFQEHPITMSDGTQIMVWLKKGQKEKPLLLFFHGNKEQNHFYSHNLKPFIQGGYSVAMMEYRGFGSTPGGLTQDRVFQDAKETYDWLKKQGYTHVIPYGYSFGTAVATYLASERNTDGLILLAPFASLSRLIKEMPYPFAHFILKYDYHSDLYAQKITTPVLIIHGTQDPTIPVHHAQILYDAFLSKEKNLVLLQNETHRSVFFQEKSVPVLLKWLETKEKNFKK